MINCVNIFMVIKFKKDKKQLYTEITKMKFFIVAHGLNIVNIGLA